MADRVESVTRQQIDEHPDFVAQAARQDGGVRVVDDDGKLLFTISIPMTDITEHCDGCNCSRRPDLPEWKLAYLAGILDGESYIAASVSRQHLRGRLREHRRLRVRVRMCDEITIEWLHAHFAGTRAIWVREPPLQRQFEWNVNSARDVGSVLRQALPYMTAKAWRARLVLAYLDDKSDETWDALMSTNSRTLRPPRRSA